jgi:hypothetical protein
MVVNTCVCVCVSCARKQNCSREEIKTLNSGNACYRSLLNLFCFPFGVFENKVPNFDLRGTRYPSQWPNSRKAWVCSLAGIAGSNLL